MSKLNAYMEKYGAEATVVVARSIYASLVKEASVKDLLKSFRASGVADILRNQKPAAAHETLFLRGKPIEGMPEMLAISEAVNKHMTEASAVAAKAEAGRSGFLNSWNFANKDSNPLRLFSKAKSLVDADLDIKFQDPRTSATLTAAPKSVDEAIKRFGELDALAILRRHLHGNPEAQHMYASIKAPVTEDQMRFKKNFLNNYMNQVRGGNTPTLSVPKGDRKNIVHLKEDMSPMFASGPSGIELDNARLFGKDDMDTLRRNANDYINTRANAERNLKESWQAKGMSPEQVSENLKRYAETDGVTNEKELSTARGFMNLFGGNLAEGRGVSINDINSSGKLRALLHSHLISGNPLHRGEVGNIALDMTRRAKTRGTSFTDELRNAITDSNAPNSSGGPFNILADRLTPKRDSFKNMKQTLDDYEKIKGGRRSEGWRMAYDTGGLLGTGALMAGIPYLYSKSDSTKNP